MALAIEYRPEAEGFAREVSKRSGQNLFACYQCRRCAAGCAVGDETGAMTPDRLIRTVLLGDKPGALSNQLAWRCVSCHACGTRCPNRIQTARIAETLKQMSKEAGLEPLCPKVGAFHQSFLESAARWGRLNELEFMGLYELRNSLHDFKQGDPQAIIAEMLAQTKLAISMLLKKRMHFGFQTARGRSELRRLMKKAKARKK